MQRLEDVHLVSHLDEVARASQPRGAAADDSNLLTRGRRGFRHAEVPAGPLPVGDKALEVGDADGLALFAQDAAGLALIFHRTHAAGDRRERVVFADLGCGAGKVAGKDQVDDALHIDRHRTLLDASGVGALDATQRFLTRLLDREAEVHFLEVVRALAGILLGYALAGQLDALFIRQRVVALGFGLSRRSLTHRSPPSLLPERIRLCDSCGATGRPRLADRPAGARYFGAPARDTYCCAASAPRS